MLESLCSLISSSNLAGSNVTLSWLTVLAGFSPATALVLVLHNPEHWRMDCAIGILKKETSLIIIQWNLSLHKPQFTAVRTSFSVRRFLKQY